MEINYVSTDMLFSGTVRLTTMDDLKAWMGTLPEMFKPGKDIEVIFTLNHYNYTTDEFEFAIEIYNDYRE